MNVDPTTPTVNADQPIPCDGATQGVGVLLLLTRDEVATALRVTGHTIDNLHRTKQLSGVLVGKHLRWRPADVKAFVEGLGNDAV